VEINAPDAGVTYVTSMLTTVSFFYIENRSSTITVGITHRSAGNGVTSFTTLVAPGQFYCTFDFTAANDVVLNGVTGAAVCRMYISGT
jgi:hypothetical protein